MEDKLEQLFRKDLGPEYDHSAKPTVYFFDHAVPIQSDDRPRFKNAVYISKTSKTGMGTQDFHAKASAEDKAEFAREWQYYLAVKENLAKPRVAMLPGIDQATLAEMKAIDIHSLEQLLAQDEFNDWKQLARRILDAINTDGSNRGDRIQGHQNGQSVGILGENRAGETQNGQEKGSQEKGKEKSYQESQPQKVTFDFGMTL